MLGTRFSSSGSGSMAQRRRVGRCLPVPDKVGQRSTALPRLPLFQGVGAALWRIKSIGSLVAAQSHNLGDGSCVIDILSCLRKRSSKCGQSAAGRRSIKACSKRLRPLAHCRVMTSRLSRREGTERFRANDSRYIMPPPASAAPGQGGRRLRWPCCDSSTHSASTLSPVRIRHEAQPPPRCDGDVQAPWGSRIATSPPSFSRRSRPIAPLFFSYEQGSPRRVPAGWR